MFPFSLYFWKPHNTNRVVGLFVGTLGMSTV